MIEHRSQKHWYVLHTYSGFEDKVAENIRQRIGSFHLEEKVFQVLVPLEKRIKIKNGKRKIVEEKVFPGYVLVEMITTPDSWYMVRNTPGVTGFVGAGNQPVPVSEKEMENLYKRMGVDTPEFEFDIEAEDLVKITDGPFKNFEGKVSDVDKARGKLKVLVAIFGRETPVELDFLQVKKL